MELHLAHSREAKVPQEILDASMESVVGFTMLAFYVTHNRWPSIDERETALGAYFNRWQQHQRYAAQIATPVGAPIAA